MPSLRRKRLVQASVWIISLAAFGIIWSWPTHGEIILVNESGIPLTDVQLHFDIEDEEPEVFERPQLEPGERLHLVTPATDVSIQMRFRAYGVTNSFSSAGAVAAGQTLTIRVDEQMRLHRLVTYRGK